MAKLSDELAGVILAARDAIWPIRHEQLTVSIYTVEALVKGSASLEDVKTAREKTDMIEDEHVRHAAERILSAAMYAATGQHFRIVAAAACDAVLAAGKALALGAPVK